VPVVHRPGLGGGGAAGPGLWTTIAGQTVDATPLDLGSTPELLDDSAYAIEAVFSGTDGAGLAVTYKRTANVYRDGGFAQLAPFSPVAEVDIDNGGATDATIAVGGSDNLAYFRVTGLGGTTIEWSVAYRMLRAG
jgi:hypothetical protein